MKNSIFYVLLTATIILFHSCIGDDFIDDRVDPVLRITNPIDSISFGDSYQYEASYFNEVGLQESVDLLWTSSNPEIITVDQTGLVTGIEAGSSTITAEYLDGDILLQDSHTLGVGENTVIEFASASGEINTTTFYTLEGDFEIQDNETGLTISIFDNYEATAALPGLFIYLSNNRNSIANATEISEVTVFDGAHQYEVEGVSLLDYQYIVYFCKPFNVKVGDAEY